jgi:hypothetical protein
MIIIDELMIDNAGSGSGQELGQKGIASDP